MNREEFFWKHGLNPELPLIVLLPGSRPGEVGRHLRYLPRAVELIRERREVSFVMALPVGFPASAESGFFKPLREDGTIGIVKGETWDAIAAADVALAASGTVTVETALLGTPMVAYYRVTEATWWLGRPFVRSPYYSMVNLVAGRQVVPELIQHGLTPERLAAEALNLLENPAAREKMREELGEVARRLSSRHDPMDQAAQEVAGIIKRK